MRRPVCATDDYVVAGLLRGLGGFVLDAAGPGALPLLAGPGGLLALALFAPAARAAVPAAQA